MSAHRNITPIQKRVEPFESDCSTDIVSCFESAFNSLLCYLNEDLGTEQKIIRILPLPNEDFGRLDERFRMFFRSTFQGHEYLIWAKNRWKVLRKRILKHWFVLRKFIHAKRRFWKAEQQMEAGFSKHFSRAWVLDLGYESLKSQSKSRISSVVHPSKIFVWGAWTCEFDGHIGMWLVCTLFDTARTHALRHGYLGYVPLKLLRKCIPKCSFGLPKSSFGENKLYKMITKDSSHAPQTKIFENRKHFGR